MDRTIGSSTAGLFYFDMYPADDPRIMATMETGRDRLWMKTDIGSIAHCENDTYHQNSKDIDPVPGNPWIICTLWRSHWHIARAHSEQDLQPALGLLRWVADRALSSGVLPEQIHPNDAAPISVSPLTWSRATVVATVLEYLDRLSDLQLCLVCELPTHMRERRKLRRLH